MEVKNNLDVIVDIAKKMIPLNQAFLFGSYAYGTPRQNSDYDLYFIVEKKEDSNYDTIVKLSSAIRNAINKPVDVLLRTKDEFYFRASNKTTLEHKVLNNGVQIYGQ